MAIDRPTSAGAFGIALGLILVGAPAAPAQVKRDPIGTGEYWVITNRDWDHYIAAYGDPQWIDLEELLTGNARLSGAVRTRGILHVGPVQNDPASTPGAKAGSDQPPAGGANRPSGSQRSSPSSQGGRRMYALTLPMHTMASLSIQPGVAIERDFDFQADALNLREVEVVGTFEAPVGSDRGPTGFWFWAYSIEPTRNSHVPFRAGLVALEDLVARPDRVAGKTVTVQGQFRGRNLFRDLDAAGAPSDGWVIKDGPFAVWVVGRKPKGGGWSLDPESQGDTTRWVQVTGKLESKSGVTRLRAEKVDLVAPPTESARP